MIDLNKRKAARKREGKKQPIVVKMGTDTFELPAEMPFESVVAFISMTKKNGPDVSKVFTDVLKQLLGTQYAKFMGHNPSLEDIVELVEGLMDEYGMAVGESPASAVS